VKQATLDARGILFDRHWMLVDEQGGFLSQRTDPRMALVDQRIEGDELVIEAPGFAPLRIPSQVGTGEAIAVDIWKDRCQASLVGSEADAWFSRVLGRFCRLVYLPASSVRAVDPSYASPTDQTGFSDGFPLLIISNASLSDLNQRLDSPLAMQRFRPNLVIHGCEPYEEDRWREIRIGDIGFRLVKPCSRCAITTIDPVTTKKSAEPLRTLARYRRADNKVYFGQNTLHDAPGELREGMEVEIVSIGEPKLVFGNAERA